MGGKSNQVRHSLLQIDVYYLYNFIICQDCHI